MGRFCAVESKVYKTSVSASRGGPYHLSVWQSGLGCCSEPKRREMTEDNGNKRRNGSQPDWKDANCGNLYQMWNDGLISVSLL